MPPLTRWLVKTSFLYLALALTLSLFLAVQPLLDLTPLSSLFPIYIHLLVFGWLTQLIFGVIFWMFPIYSKAKPRRSDTLGWWTYILLNAGLLLRGLVEPFNSTQPNPFTGWVLVLSAILQFFSGLAFVVNTWGRVKER